MVRFGSLAGAMLWVLWSPLATAELGVLDKMINPGELSQAHKDFDEKCDKCHKRFDKSAQSGMCMSCHDHKHIAHDVKNRLGFHGRVQEKACNSCHQEHKGRKHEIVLLNTRTFNHDQTDFALVGKHADKKIKCTDCHKKGKTYREAPQRCVSCHKNDDEHKGSLGEKCESCHNPKSWKSTWFDHDKTHFPLRGKHSKAKCEKCHKDKDYKKTPRDCFSCHKKDDKHKGSLGKDCGQCHLESGWKKAKFDHGLTRYPLLGKHADAKCQKCHKRKDYKDFKRLPDDCYSCHKKDDEHKRKLGTKCEVCHNEKGWKYWKFNHDKQTDFPLTGKHKGLKCDVCHHKPIDGKVSLPGTCVGCHQEDDVHGGEFGQYCERCHTSKSFREIKPLMGF